MTTKDLLFFYLIWFLLHLIFISIGDGRDGFWPFGWRSGLSDYGFTEFAFHLIVPIVIWALWKLIGKDIKKKIDENNLRHANRPLSAILKRYRIE